MSKSRKPPHHNAMRLADQDYWEKLTPDEETWLREFNSGHYRGDFSSDPRKEKWPDEKRREVYNANRPRREDLFLNFAAPLVEDYHPGSDPEDPPDLEPTPDYLNHPVYKAALQAVRDVKIPRGPGREEAKAERERRQERLRQITRLGIAGLL